MRQQLSNFTYGVLDYGAYPIGMLIVAPFILRNLGVAQYGIWTVTASVVNIGSVVASGFGDACTQRIAARISSGQQDEVAPLIRAAMGIHLTLAVLIAAAVWFVAPALAGRLSMHDPSLLNTCVDCIRLAGALTAIRAFEAVCIGTQKAYQRYGPALRTSIAGRLLSLAAAAAMASRGKSVIAIMAVTALLTFFALAVQVRGLQHLVGGLIAPAYEDSLSKDLVRFGFFTWVLAVANLAFSQADRLAGGASVGAAAIVSYALCAQLCQPVYGLTAAGLHFLFPYLASRRPDEEPDALARTLLLAIAANVALALIGAGSLLTIGNRLLRLLANDELARASKPLLPVVLAGSALLALSVTGSYAMVALGKVRTAALLNFAGCFAMVLFTAAFLRERGVMAFAEGRIMFALIALCVYIPLFTGIRHATSGQHFATAEVVEEA